MATKYYNCSKESFLFTNLPIGLPFTDRYHRNTQAELVITIKYLGTFGKTLITL
jgi:hypothetical protein